MRRAEKHEWMIKQLKFLEVVPAEIVSSHLSLFMRGRRGPDAGKNYKPKAQSFWFFFFGKVKFCPCVLRDANWVHLIALKYVHLDILISN